MSKKIIIFGQGMLSAKDAMGRQDFLDMIKDAFEGTDYEYEYVVDNCFNPGKGDDTMGSKQVVLKIETEGPGFIHYDQETLDKLREAEGLVVYYSAVNKQLLDACPNLKYVQVMRSGVENVDVRECAAHGVTVSNAPGRVAKPVSEMACALILDCIRGMTLDQKNWYVGKPDKFPDYIPMLVADYTIGIVGFGQIGKRVAQHMHDGFGCRIVAYDPFVDQKTADGYHATMMPLEDLMKTADIVTIHARLLPETEGMIGAKEIALMKKTAAFINTARAGLIDEDALLAALREHRIRCAALDVFKQEPLPDDSEFRTLDNVIVTTHHAGMAGDPVVLSGEITWAEVKRYTHHEQLRCIVK